MELNRMGMVMGMGMEIGMVEIWMGVATLSAVCITVLCAYTVALEKSFRT